VPAVVGLHSQLIASLAASLQQADHRSKDQCPVRCRLIVQAALLLASEASAPDLREPSLLADQLTTLISCLSLIPRVPSRAALERRTLNRKST
jgi:hypothetical protein